MSMPCDCSWRTVPSTRRWRSPCTSASGGSISVSPVSASVTRPTSSWRAWLSLDSPRRSAIDSRQASTVSNSPKLSATNSSVSSGTTSSCTAPTVTTKSAGSSVPFGRRRERQHVTGGGADELLVEVVGDPALADLVGPVLGVQPGDLLAVAGGDEVERDAVAAGGRALDVGELAVAAQLGLDGLVDLLVGRRRRRQLDAQAVVAGHGDLGAHLAGGVEPDGPVLLAGGDLHLRRGDEVDVVLADGLGQVLGDRVAQRLLAGRGDADAGLEHPARRLAGAEPGQPDLAGDLAERRVDVLVELGLVDVHRQLDLVALQGLQRALHRPPRVSGGCHGTRVLRRAADGPGGPRRRVVLHRHRADRTLATRKRVKISPRASVRPSTPGCARPAPGRRRVRARRHRADGSLPSTPPRSCRSQPVFSANDNGSIAIFGNNLMVCPASVADCAGARARHDDEEQQRLHDGAPRRRRRGVPDVLLLGRRPRPARPTPRSLWAGLYWGARLAPGPAARPPTGNGRR